MIERIDVAVKNDNPVYDLFRVEHIRRYVTASSWIYQCISLAKSMARTHRIPWIEFPAIADMACGDGYGYDYLYPIGSYHGYDNNHDALRLCYPRLGQRRTGARHMSNGFFHINMNDPSLIMNKSQYDFIVSLETIEHLDSPARFLNLAYSILKPYGVLILSAPTCKTKDYDPYHKHDFTSDELGGLITSCGFYIAKKMEMPFSGKAGDFFSCVPTTLAQKLRVAFYNFTHPFYLLDRIYNWGFKGKFHWNSTMYLCFKTREQAAIFASYESNIKNSGLFSQEPVHTTFSRPIGIPANTVDESTEVG